MLKGYRAAAVVIGLAFLVVLSVLAREQNGPPSHEEVTLSGEIPATFYMPGTENRPGPNDPFYQLFPSPPEKRPPAVVLIHGFTSDRVATSSLARRLAQNGYGVLAIDLSGHGENRNPFSREKLRDDVSTAVAFLRQSPLVDPSRIVVMGHSMGAGATIDYASRDRNLAAAVMISGGFSLDGPERPRNALWIYAQNDLPFFSMLAQLMSSHVAGVDKVELGKRYGDFANGTAVEAIEVPSTNHLTILWSSVAAQHIIEWLDSACNVKRDGAINLADPRLNTILLVLLLFTLLMFPVGRVVGSFADRHERPAFDRSTLVALVVLLVALFVAMPLTMVTVPMSFVSLVVGNAMVSWVALAGGLLLVFAAFQRPDETRNLVRGTGRSLTVALFAFAAIYVMSAYDVTLHRATFTPERMVITLVGAILAFPFFVAMELMLRRGSVIVASLLTAAGFVLILIATTAGLSLGAIPFGVATPAMAIQFLEMELLAAGMYAVSSDLLAIAAFESLWFVRLFALAMPIVFKF